MRTLWSTSDGPPPRIAPSRPAAPVIRAALVHARRTVVPPVSAERPDTARPGSDRRPGRGVALDRILIALAAAGWGITVAWLVSGIGSPDARLASALVDETALDLLAAALVLRAALRVDGRRVRLGWAVVGIATLVYAVGDGAWAWVGVVAGSTASPPLSDVAYVTYYPMVVVALLIFQSTSSGRRDTLRLTIDSLIVFIGGGIVVWHTLFRPLLASLDPDPVTAALALGYPVGDLVLLFGVAATALRRSTIRGGEPVSSGRSSRSGVRSAWQRLPKASRRLSSSSGCASLVACSDRATSSRGPWSRTPWRTSSRALAGRPSRARPRWPARERRASGRAPLPRSSSRSPGGRAAPVAEAAHPFERLSAGEGSPAAD